MTTQIEAKIEAILEDMGERPFARTWETEEKNMRKILTKHLQDLLPESVKSKEEEVERCAKCGNCIKRDYDDEYCCECGAKL